MGTRPVFEVRNGTVEGRTVPVTVEIQVSSNDDFSGRRLTASEEAGERTTELRLREALTPAVRYYWQARGTATTGSGSRITSPWSGTESFLTAAAHLGAPTPVSPVQGAEVSTVSGVQGAERDDGGCHGGGEHTPRGWVGC